MIGPADRRWLERFAVALDKAVRTPRGTSNGELVTILVSDTFAREAADRLRRIAAEAQLEEQTPRGPHHAGPGVL
jgi:hypothetical protein